MAGADDHQPVALGAQVPEQLGPARPAELARLTARETEVLRLIAGGLSNAGIAARLVLGENP